MIGGIRYPIENPGRMDFDVEFNIPKGATGVAINGVYFTAEEIREAAVSGKSLLLDRKAKLEGEAN